LVQLNSGLDADRNVGRAEDLIRDLAPVDLIALPEVFALRGDDADYQASAQPLDGPLVTRMARIASGRSAYLLLGSVMEKAGEHIHNTSVLLNRSGKIAATYRKMHQFEVRLDDGTVVREADTYTAGDEPTITGLDGWQVGLSICYDLRFPELYRRYSREGADLMFAPANFTQQTGRAHWEVLVRARAIENQCFVLAPNQCGINPATKVVSHGHSMIVGPWGEIMSEAGEDEQVLTAELTHGALASVRSKLPALKHRRL
jgi:predicted amidohydrolase